MHYIYTFSRRFYLKGFSEMRRDGDNATNFSVSSIDNTEQWVSTFFNCFSNHVKDKTYTKKKSYTQLKRSS